MNRLKGSLCSWLTTPRKLLRVSLTATTILAGAASPSPMPLLTVDPSPVAFGEAGWNQRIMKSLWVRNLGDAPLEVGVPLVMPRGEFQVVSPRTNFTVPPAGDQILLLDFVPTRLGEHGSELVLLSNDPARPRVTVPLTGVGRYPVLEIAPLRVDFGSVAAGQSQDRSFTVRNVGTAPLTVRGMRMNSPHFQGVSPQQGYTLPAGATQNVTVRFTPQTHGDLEVDLHTLSDAANSDAVIVTLAGMGLAPRLAVDPASLDFGEVTTGGFEERSVVFRNVGNQPLTVQAIQAGNPYFRAVGPTRPFNVAVGASQEVRVRFNPCGSGTLAGELRIESNDPQEPTFLLPVTGGAAASPETVISLNSRDGEVVTWTYDNGRIQRIRVWLDTSLRITPHNPQPAGDHFRSGTATVEGLLHLWGEATDVDQGEYDEFRFDHEFRLNLSRINFTSWFDPVRGLVIFLSGPLAVRRPDQATPYRFEFEGATGRLRLWVELPRPWNYAEEDEYYDLRGVACLSSTPPVRIVSIDDQPAGNARTHATTEYWTHQRRRLPQEQWLVLRRGQALSAVVTLSRKLIAGETIHFHAEDQTGIAGVADAPHPSKADNQVWPVRIEPADVGKARLRVQIEIPPDAPLGRYRLTARVQEASQPEDLAAQDFPRPIVVLFNPWLSSEQVHCGAAERQAYVLKQAGVIYQYQTSTHPDPALFDVIPKPRTWEFSQFTAEALATALALIRDLAPPDRASAPAVARKLCELTSSATDPGKGLLTACWVQCDEPLARLPRTWSDSQLIFADYAAGERALKYAQCPNLSGVLTSLLRSVGVPARPVTAYHAGRDLNGDGKLTVTYRSTDQGPVQSWAPLPDSELCSDKLWVFHVWCEAWLPGTTSGRGWHLLDASPSRPEDWPDCTFAASFPCVGPVSVDAIRGMEPATFGDAPAELRYAFGAVRAPLEFVLADPTTGPDVCWDFVAEAADSITTQGPAGNSEDRTGAYKPSNQPRRAAPAPGNLAVDFGLRLVSPSVFSAGRDLPMDASVTNLSGRRIEGRLLLNLALLRYDGTELGIATLLRDDRVALEHGESLASTHAIKEADYLPWLQSSPHLEARLLLLPDGDAQPALAVRRFTLIPPPLEISVQPDTRLALGGRAKCVVHWTNALSFVLPRVSLYVSVGDGLGMEDTPDPGNVEIPLGSLSPGASIAWSTIITGFRQGESVVRAAIRCDELPDVEAAAILEVGPHIELSIQRLPSGVEISFPADEGQSYRLESAQNLALPEWSDSGIEPRPMDGRVVWLVPSASAERHRFYRARLVDP